MRRSKHTDARKNGLPRDKTTARAGQTGEKELSMWTFEKVDRDGKFKFDPSRTDFNCQDFLNKLLAFSSMTWGEISRQTHDAGKSKHHFLSEKSLSKEAAARLKEKGLLNRSDCIYSFALNNIARVIGIRVPNSPLFQVVWYDANHEFAPSSLKRT